MVLSPTGMLELVSTHDIQLFNPLMNKRKRYMALRLKDVLDSVYGETWSSSDHSDISFRALDGYEAMLSLALLLEDGAFLAYADIDREHGWEPIGRKLADPGPFLLVWNKKHQTTANAYP